MNIRLLNIFNFFIIIIYTTVLILNYSSLPQLVPSHIGISGKVDEMQDKDFVFKIPIINLLLFAFVEFFRSRPHILNYGTVVTEKNRASLYSGMQKFLAIVNLIITISFFLISSYLYLLFDSLLLKVSIILLVLLYLISTIIFFKGSKRQNNV